MHKPQNPENDIQDPERIIRESQKPENAFLIPRTVDDLSDYLPPQLLRNTLYQGCKLVVGASPKMRKSWFMMQLCYCIANGIPFLEIETLKGKVAYVNFELLEGECRQRFKDIQTTLQKGSCKNIDVYQLRGKRLTEKTLEILKEHLCANDYVICIFDPFYKIMKINSEFSDEMSKILNWIDEVGADSFASTGVAQHFAKGNAALKHAIDRLSGSNWIARDGDCLFIMTELSEEECARIDVIHRSFVVKAPFGVRFQYPIFKIDPDINISQIKEPTSVQNANPTDNRILAALLATEEKEDGKSFSDLLKAVQIIDIKTKKPNPSLATFKRRLSFLQKTKSIIKSALNGNYMVAPQYSTARSSFWDSEAQSNEP
jgi:hypothetical protein